jgi:hypothetical protein
MAFLVLVYLPAMLSFNKIVTLIAVALSLTAVSAFGDTFDFSYTFGNAFYGGTIGDVISGSFDGTLNGNYVDNISNITMAYNGVAMPGTYYTGAYTGNYSWVSGPIVSFDATLNDFGFNTDPLVNGQFSGPPGSFLYFVGIPGYSTTSGGLPDVYGGTSNTINETEDNPMIPGNWVLTDVSAVPDSGATITMLGMAVAGLVGLRRRLR